MHNKGQIDIERIVERLTTVHSVSALVGLAFRNAKRLGFDRLRFYEYIPNGLRLVSRESSGHERGWAEKFRCGNVVRRQSEFPLAKRESFWCFHEHVPIAVLRHNDRPSGDLQLKNQFNTKCLVTTFVDYRFDPLPFDNRNICVHFPLKAGGRYIGKFCCDAEDLEISEATEQRIEEYKRFCQLIAPAVEMLLSRERNPAPLELGLQNRFPGLPREMLPKNESVRLRAVRAKVLRDMKRMKSASELLDYCTFNLPHKFFGCKFASFFTVSEDPFGSKLLVLRRTSYQKIKGNEDLACYDLNKKGGLTAWVARNKRPLRFSNLKELELHRSGAIMIKDGDGDIPIWADEITDSDVHNGFLAVPVLSDSDELLGVLRLTQKVEQDDIFSEADEVLLTRLAREYIAPRLENLVQAQRFHFILERLPNVVSMGVQDSVTNRRLAEALTEVLKECIPSGKGKKGFLVNKPDTDSKCFYVDHLGGDLTFLAPPEYERIDLKGTLMEMALKADQRGALYVQDFAKAGIADAVHSRVPDAKSALACRVSFRSKDYGVLIVLSDRYDLTRIHARLLELTCMIAGGIRAKRELHSFELTQMGLGHDFATQLESNQKILERLLANYPADVALRNEIERVAKMNRHAMNLLSTYLSPISLAPSIIEANAVLDVPVASMIQEAVGPAEAAVGKPGLINVQVGNDMCARIWEEPVSAIIFNLLKNALGACSRKDGVIEVRAQGEGNWLKIIVANNGSYISEDAKRGLSFDPMSLFLGSVRQYGGGKGYGLYIASRLAMCYRMSDGRNAEIAYRKVVGMCPTEFTLTIPVLLNLE